MIRKALSPTYFAFFCSRFGPIVLLVFVPTFFIYMFSDDNDLELLLCVFFTCFFAVSLLVLSEYRRLKKNIRLSKVVLVDDTLQIDDNNYSAEVIELITSIALSNALDKYNLYLVEIKMNTGEKYYFLDKPMGWSFESPTIRLLKKHSVLSLKVNDNQIKMKGFSSLNE